jgi:hypothetical protein
MVSSAVEPIIPLPGWRIEPRVIADGMRAGLPALVDEIRSRLRIGLHWDVDVMHAGVRCIRWCRRHSAPQFPWLIMGKQP